MPNLVFVLRDGTRQTVDATSGASAMLAAVKHDVRGIDAECGGACACATCHVYVDDAWTDTVGPPNPDEADMLEGVAAERRPESRLSCQIAMDDALDGLVLHIPERQT